MQFYIVDILYIFKSIKITRKLRTMALLLAMYQKMRLIREINEGTLKLTKISSKISRVTKNIERTQKRYTSLFAQLKQQATQMQSSAKLMFQNMAGIGNDCVNPYNYSGMNGFVSNMMQGMLANGIQLKKDADPYTIDSAKFQEMMTIYMQNGGRFPAQYGKDNAQEHDESGTPLWENNLTNDDVLAFNQAMRLAQNQQQRAQMWVQQADTQYGNNISIWLQNAEAQLEAEQDAALEPLQYEDTMLQLEKEQLDARLQRLRAEKESYDQLASEEAKNMAPTFGLR